ncbi:MAG TPA: GFA family protein [Gaiellaceae bacterium]
MSTPREGGCACGAVRYRLASEPLFVHCCHCLNCQRQTGSAFVVNLLIEAERVELLAGEPQPVEAPRDDGSCQTIYRCPDCQIAVYSDYGRPQILFVRGGTLDDPTGITPDVHIFTKSKVGWVTLPDSTPAFEIYYDRKTLWPAESQERIEAVLRAAVKTSD